MVLKRKQIELKTVLYISTLVIVKCRFGNIKFTANFAKFFPSSCDFSTLIFCASLNFDFFTPFFDCFKVNTLFLNCRKKAALYRIFPTKIYTLEVNLLCFVIFVNNQIIHVLIISRIILIIRKNVLRLIKKISKIFEDISVKKVALFSTHSFWPYHFETELEIIVNELDKGSKVTKYVCQKERDFCLYFEENMMSNKRDLCSFCNKRNHNSEIFLKKSFKTKIKQVQFNLDSISVPKLDSKFLISINELKKLKIKNFDIGYAILSSLISIHENPNIVPIDYEENIYKMYNEAIKLYFYTISQIKKNNFDCIYIFNGRFYDARAVLRAAEYMKVDCYVHERGSDLNKFSLTKNTFPHDKTYFNNKVQELWLQNLNSNLKTNIAKTFYENRRKGIIKNWVSFTNNQILNYLNLKNDKKIITLFTSSEDEFMSIDSSYENGVFKSQLDALDYISILMSKELIEFQLIVRMHPNSKRMGKDYIDSYLRYKKHNIIIIGPEDLINSYYILDKTEIVLTYGSTIGLEATYYGKKTIDLSNGIYSKLDGPKKLLIKEQLIEFIFSEQLFYSYSMDAVIKTGYYLETYGQNFKYFKPKNLFEGEFLDVNYNKL